MEKRFKTFDLKTTPKIIVITGAESTGKSTLTETLASYFNVPFIPEIARDYVEKLNRKYTYQDVEIIARKQVEMLHQLKNSNAPFIFVDTWLVVTKIWFDLVFQKEPDWLLPEIEKTKIDLVLVCDIDLPWIADPVRENGGEKRKMLHKKYIETLNYFNFEYKIVSGKNKRRNENALQFLNELK
jgi:NadR type nicotinamide-nucleotide adenylyltransferase